MTDDICRAQYTMGNGGPWPCVLSENHAGPHKDEDNDTWDITYRDRTLATYTAPEDERDGNYLHGRSHDDLIKELYQRVSNLETDMHPEECHGEQCVKQASLSPMTEKMQAFRERIQESIANPQDRCAWISPTNLRCNLPAGHTVNHITPYPPEHVCGPCC